MCGIFGYLGKETPDLNKFKILGIYNQERGTESAGIMFNKNLKKTSNFKNSVFKNFINSEMPRNYEPCDRNFLMGHVRKASSGGINVKTAQPFTYVLKNKLQYVFCHNGTLKNWQIKAKKDFSKTDFVSDSQMLGNYLADKRYSILENYEGNAAFAGYDYKTEELILFRGSHKLGNNFVDERPMFILKTKNGIWYSSMESSLEAIAEKGEKPEEIDSNTVYEIDKNQNIKTTKINRTYVEPFQTAKPYKSSGFNDNYHNNKQHGNAFNNKPSKGSGESYFFNDMLLKGQPNIFKGHMYYYRGRYYRNGKLMQGFYNVDSSGAIYPKAPPRLFYNGFMLKNSYNLNFKEFKEKIDGELSKISSGNIKALNISDYVEGPVKLLKEDTKIGHGSDLCINGRVMKPEDMPYRPLGVRNIQIDGNHKELFHIKKFKQDVFDVLDSLSFGYWENFDFNNESWWSSLDKETFNYYSQKELDLKKNQEDDFQTDLFNAVFELNESIFNLKSEIEDKPEYHNLYEDLEFLESNVQYNDLTNQLFEEFENNKL